MNKVFCLFLTLGLFSCKQEANTEIIKNNEVVVPQGFSEEVAQAHNKAGFDAKAFVTFDFVLEFGGSERFRGRIASDVFSNQAELIAENGDSIYVEKADVFYNPTYSKPEGVRFQAYTWTYFFLLPYKLQDPGTKWEAYTPEYDLPTGWSAEKLTFEKGIGDTADDWYIVFVNEKKQIQYVAYIVTAGKDQAEAEKEPHAIVYKKYTQVEGVPLATEWEFRNWTPKEGLGEQLGKAEVTNLRFAPEWEFIQKNNFKKS